MAATRHYSTILAASGGVSCWQCPFLPLSPYFGWPDRLALSGLREEGCPPSWPAGHLQRGWEADYPGADLMAEAFRWGGRRASGREALVGENHDPSGRQGL